MIFLNDCVFIIALSISLACILQLTIVFPLFADIDPWLFSGTYKFPLKLWVFPSSVLLKSWPWVWLIIITFILFVHLLLRVASRRKWKKTSSRPTTERGYDFSFVDRLQKERITCFRFTKEIKSTNDDGQLSRCMCCDVTCIAYRSFFLEQGVIPIF